MPARLKLNLFSPLPPLRSEIGNHTLTVASALRSLAEVTLWVTQEEVDRRGLDLPVVQYDPAAPDWARLNAADAQIYNLGNNATFHRGLFDVARRAPGIVVLHDTRLQHFFARYSETLGEDRAFYLETMRRTHGPAALADAQRWLHGTERLDTLVERYPMTLAALDPALAGVVHDAAAQEVLARDTRTPVFHLPLAHRAGPPPQRVAGPGPLRLIVFGFIGPNRRLDALLDAIAALPELDLRLDVYGSLDEREPVERQIAALGLGERVSLHGFVSAEELTEALGRAHLAINLRYPTMGEASASQLRIWEAALPSVVTRIGWYATLPEDSVFFVAPGQEVEGLCTILRALQADPARFVQAGQRGRAVLEARHDPALYAEGLLEVASQSPTLYARRTAVALSRRSARALMAASEPVAMSVCATPVGSAVAALTRR